MNILYKAEIYITGRGLRSLRKTLERSGFYMETRTGTNNEYRFVNIMNFINRLILKTQREIVFGAEKPKPEREVLTKIPENPAAGYPLGWRKDA